MATTSTQRRLLWQTMLPSSQDMVKALLPRLLVNPEAIKNRPSPHDPLGAKPALQLNWSEDARNNQWKVCVTLHGEHSPWMEPEALTVWLAVQYPDTFKVAYPDDNGKP